MTERLVPVAGLTAGEAREVRAANEAAQTSLFTMNADPVDDPPKVVCHACGATNSDRCGCTEGTIAEPLPLPEETTDG